MRRHIVQALSLLSLMTFGSCWHSHKLQDPFREINMHGFCEICMAGNYKTVVESFNEFLADGNSNRDMFAMLSDTCWKVVEDDGRRYVNGVTLTIGKDSIITYHHDGVVDEDEYRTHIFTPGDGVRDGSGIIRLEVELDNAKYGWAEVEFQNGKETITTGTF